MNGKGFTLIELVMIIVILGLLAIVAVPKFLDMRDDAEEGVIDAWVGALQEARTAAFAKAVLSGNTSYKNQGAISFWQFLQYDGGEPRSFEGSQWGTGNTIGLAGLRSGVFKDPNQDAVTDGGMAAKETITFTTKTGRTVVITREAYNPEAGTGGEIRWQATPAYD